MGYTPEYINPERDTPQNREHRPCPVCWAILKMNGPAGSLHRDQSAFLFAREDFSRICATTFFCAAFAGKVLGGRDQAAGTAIRTAECVLSALVPQLVDSSTDLWGIGSAGETKSMTTREPAPGQYRSGGGDHRR